MRKLRFGIAGAGFWANYQLAGWHETGGAVCVAIADPRSEAAEHLAVKFGIPAVYKDVEAMLASEQLDFLDIASNVESHAPLVLMAANRRLNVVCQKPMATTIEEAQLMVEACRSAGVLLLINENWRWQAPIRAIAHVLEGGEIGTPFRARIDMISGFPVFVNQPALKHLKQFILTDLGTHLLDTMRFLFGEPRSLYCQTQKVHSDIAGEDVASIMLRTRSEASVIVNMAYAENFLERESFPETFVFVEASKGSLELGPGCELRATTASGTQRRSIRSPEYSWADPAYAVVHASIVPCQVDLLRALGGEGHAETEANDNLRTARLVAAAYDSAAKNQVIVFDEHGRSTLAERA